jgi:phosphoribosylformimino-5-aminoimidazole carboxamide ribotide isomerase
MQFVLYPAIDILNGKCVRLHQGDYTREKIYNDDPVAQAQKFASDGAQWIHVVDLDAARTGEPINREVVSRIASAVSIPIQTGGGVRSVESAMALLDCGVERIVIGTAAVENPDMIENLANRGFRIAVGLDGRNGFVATRGWQNRTDLKVAELAIKFENLGVEAVIVTEIERDGTLEGPDIDGLQEVLLTTTLEVIASGGVGSLDDLKTLVGFEANKKKLGGVIAGKALYEAKFSLVEALDVCKRSLPSADNGS